MKIHTPKTYRCDYVLLCDDQASPQVAYSYRHEISQFLSAKTQNGEQAFFVEYFKSNAIERVDTLFEAGRIPYVVFMDTHLFDGYGFEVIQHMRANGVGSRSNTIGLSTSNPSDFIRNTDQGERRAFVELNQHCRRFYNTFENMDLFTQNIEAALELIKEGKFPTRSVAPRAVSQR
jgi:hypothetical protein